MTYTDAIRFLYDLSLFGLNLGLENPRQLAALAGNPQARLRFIHVAGTNGKGSTCAFLESIYRETGLRVGLYTSPHLVSFRERIQVNRQPIPEADVIRLVEEFRPLLAQFPADNRPTFFEVVTVMAARYFDGQGCDLVIWETGLGGRLDATNIVTPLASVITNVELDHEKWLGDTVEKIAREKAGIIKPGVPVITALTNNASLRILFDTAAAAGSQFFLVTWAQSERPPVSDTPLPLGGLHQRLNAALAMFTVRQLAATIPVADQQIRAGLANAQWPGRFQLLEYQGRQIVLDGAHNPAGAAALDAALMEKFPGARPAFIIGMLGDKDCPRVIEILTALASKVWLVPLRSGRAAAPETLRDFARLANPLAPAEVCASLTDALRATAREPLTVLAGSLYLIGEAMEVLGLVPSTMRSEHELNDYHPRHSQPGHGAKPA